MSDSQLSEIGQAVEINLRELVRIGGLKAGQLLVIGTSTSEVLGYRIGTSGTLNAAEPIYWAADRIAAEFGLYLAFQCCEHLNRALVVEEELLALHRLEPVSAIPVPGAGGSMASYAYRHFKQPVLVESIQANAGIDIGDTLIGMHLRRVAIPVRPPIRFVGEAHVTMAFTRPKLIGGPRAVYTEQAADEAISKSISQAAKQPVRAGKSLEASENQMAAIVSETDNCK
ncbi:TIGR01440 family protein [Paenibacillus eucommiae]|uniref:UPF0340 protein J2Z66_004190 n=1 Tax=Paenibacillus eucommiae TaxID=1355755 RepID=A0ABS4J008_9BACL|nr:TIGR01440 family protein [Paenibacillus eucommiae]MBP1992581.1 uncharacterized protein (TIGR01440 family) [Paenibacillus eucommiae]